MGLGDFRISCSEVHMQTLPSLGAKIRDLTSSRDPTEPKLFGSSVAVLI